VEAARVTDDHSLWRKIVHDATKCRQGEVKIRAELQLSSCKHHYRSVVLYDAISFTDINDKLHRQPHAAIKLRSSWMFFISRWAIQEVQVQSDGTPKSLDPRKIEKLACDRSSRRATCSQAIEKFEADCIQTDTGKKRGHEEATRKHQQFESSFHYCYVQLFVRDWTLLTREIILEIR